MFKGILLVLVAAMVLAVPLQADALVCGKDLDGDGKATDQGETAQCTGDDGLLCPIDAITCIAATSEPTCPDGGTMVPERDRCEAAISYWTCPLTGSRYGSGESCTDECSPTECRPGCSTGYTWDGTLCAANPQCASGSYDPAVNRCVDPARYFCPYGETISCKNSGGTMRCSALVCFDPNADGNEITEQNDNSMPQDDGEKDEAGNCLGTVYIFSGRSMECRTSGHSTGWKNCCLSGEAPLADDVGSAMSLASTVSTISNVYHMGQIAYYGNMIVSGAAVDISSFTPAVQTGLTAVAQSGSIMEGLMTYAQATFLNPTTLAIAAAMYLIQELLFSGSCNQEDVETAMLESSGMCHYLTTYCKKRWFLVGCVQEAKVFCCFNSKLARIVHEQGRPQLSTFSPAWSYGHSSGNCRGFTPSEFQMLDFSKMDLSEYLGDIKAKAQGTIQNTVTDKIQQYYQNTRP
jgi:conjugal transfer mating pair stabilization protein TraN